MYTRIMTPRIGEYSFGRLKDFTRYSETLKSGEIYLFRGSSRASGGFGLLHIWERHKRDLISKGYEDKTKVPLYISNIIIEGAQVYCEFASLKGNHRPMILRSRHGMVILEPKTYNGDFFYSIVTAYPKFKPEGTLLGGF